MAKGLGGLINVGQQTKKQALGGLLDAARAETQKDIAQEGLDQQRKIAEQTTAGTLTAVGACSSHVSSSSFVSHAVPRTLGAWLRTYTVAPYPHFW